MSQKHKITAEEKWLTLRTNSASQSVAACVRYDFIVNSVRNGVSHYALT